jgi:hypothetical protein
MAWHGNPLFSWDRDLESDSAPDASSNQRKASCNDVGSPDFRGLGAKRQVRRFGT